MRTIVALIAVAVSTSVAAQQTSEKKADSGSVRVSIAGCLRGRNLVTIDRRETEPVSTKMEPGKVFRLIGSKDLLKEVKKRDKTAVEVTGLVRSNSLEPGVQGMPVAGGRVRIGGMPINQDPTRVDPRRDPLANVELLDLESVRPIDAVCPTK